MLREISVSVNVLRNGAVRGVLHALGDTEPIIRAEDSADIKTTLRGSFEVTARDRTWRYVEFNPLMDELQPILSINGYSSSLGRFYPAVVEPITLNNDYLDLEAYDRCWRVQTTTGLSRVFFRAGTEYLTAIKQLLTACGIINIRATANTAVLTEDREDWDFGTDYLTIINQLLSEINYKPLWFDSTGAAVLEPKRTPTAANIQHTLDSSRPITLLRPGIRRKKDIFETPNVYIAVCDNPEKSEIMTATAVNNNPVSPLSVQKRGREIVSVVHVDNIASQAELQAYADRLIFDSMTTGETIQVESSLQLGWGVGDVVAFHYKADRAMIYLPDGTAITRGPEEINSICISKAWEMQLKPGGAMSHTLEKVVTLG